MLEEATVEDRDRSVAAPATTTADPSVVDRGEQLLACALSAKEEIRRLDAEGQDLLELATALNGGVPPTDRQKAALRDALVFEISLSVALRNALLAGDTD